MPLKIQIHEQAAGRDEYIPTAYNLEDAIYCHCAYFLVYDRPETENHWKSEIYAFSSKLKKIKVHSGDKVKYTETALVEMAHGERFCEDKDEVDAVLGAVMHSETPEHPFDFNMALPSNQKVYLDAIDKFYYEFLIPWIAVPDKEPPREPLYEAIDSYLIARRKEMVSE